MTRTIIVLAKVPVAGRVKTRLCPPCSPETAAALAAAALRDTVAAVEATDAHRRVLVADNPTDAPFSIRPGWELLPQRGAGLDERLAAAFVDVLGAGPRPQSALLVGMDTPQVTPRDIDAGFDMLSYHDAVIGPSGDGGYWTVGLHEPNDAVFVGVPMSRSDTAALQRERFRNLNLECGEIHSIDDFDTITDLRAIARAAPDLEFSRCAHKLGLVSGDIAP